jgi:hypothetical protein
MRYLRLALFCIAISGTYAIAAGTLGGCGSGGGECNGCDPDEDECDEGLRCMYFTDGLARCAAEAGDTCGGFF